MVWKLDKQEGNQSPPVSPLDDLLVHVWSGVRMLMQDDSD